MDKKNTTFFCDRQSATNSRGLFQGESPLHFSLPRLLLQVGLTNLISAIFRYLLSPFKLPMLVPQMLSGIALGPSVLGQNQNFREKMFPPLSVILLNVNELLGFMLYYFLVGVRTNIRMVKNSGRLAIIIGFTSFLFPMIVTLSIASILRASLTMEERSRLSLLGVASMECTTSFHVTAAILADLKLLNSEIGRLALSSSMVSGILTLFYITIAIHIKESAKVGTKYVLLANTISRLLSVLVVVFVFRPIMFWMIKQTPEGKQVKEAYIFIVIVTIFGCALYGEVTGGHFLMGPLIFGLAVPDGPPLGSSIVDKLSCFVSAVLTPCVIINIGRRVNLLLVKSGSYFLVLLIIMVAAVAKLLAIMVPSLYFKVPFRDALILGLLLNCQGLFDIQNFEVGRQFRVVSDESYGIMVVMTVIQLAVLTSLVRALYDPSRKYVAYRRHTIEHSRRNAEIRILACVNQLDEVPPIVNLLEATNATRENPIGLYVLDLVELGGRTSSQFIAHQFDKLPSSNPTRIDQIIKVFSKYEVHNQGTVTVQYFTAIAPYATMHDDICTLALEKSTSLVIIPFQPKENLSIRAVNKNVLEKAPCSVGIFINRGNMNSRLSSMHICVIFLDGPDDREALAYACRMADHPTVRLSVIRVVGEGNSDGNFPKLDANAVNEFRRNTIDNGRVVYKERSVTDVAGTAKVLSSLENGFDLILVGRRHDNESPLLMGLEEWSEIKELGVIGDWLVSSHFDKDRTSVLVVQQQASVVEEMVESPRFISR